MTDDPFDALDAEAARLDGYFADLDGDRWRVASRCDGWDRRAILAHLIGIEQYIQACLDDRVAAYASQAGSDVGYEDFNEYMVASMADVDTDELVSRWHHLMTEQHARLRERGADSLIETHAGPYPLGRQTWYFASELAIHADDIDAPVTDEERAERQAWRLRFGLDALRESERGVEVTETPEGFLVSDAEQSVKLSRADLVEALSGRLKDSRVPSSLRDALVALA
ncbi:uncharacterized protein (TIGR03083 family) [Stackebrandtia endophytica]|uniref:Uncharacterized protein (TIGR03083 family) n=1 Tax=Stackebrandtia endophytica TaxID=1496996 RepID=A0A543B2Y7_9ACTN|nr:maleylpyruvate isomerase family mycothiol-dependent enzyme [Stackebrandtia endophytica]TQL79198.1 uncharacterized protein (TIGR03083 family) [Stackebrandtia endophytica]